MRASEALTGAHALLAKHLKFEQAFPASAAVRNRAVCCAPAASRLPYFAGSPSSRLLGKLNTSSMISGPHARCAHIADEVEQVASHPICRSAVKGDSPLAAAWPPLQHLVPPGPETAHSAAGVQPELLHCHAPHEAALVREYLHVARVSSCNKHCGTALDSG